MTTSRRRATVILAGLVVLVPASCAGDRTEAIPAPSPSATASTTMPPTTGPETTGTASSSTSAPATSTSSSTSSTSIAPGEFPYWSTACVERIGNAGTAYEFDGRLGTFTTLGAMASLDLQAPTIVTSAGPYGSITGKSVIPGGVLVGVYPPNGWPTADELLTSSSLVAVDHDGTLRWRRCFDDVVTTTFVVAPAALEPTTAWVVTSAWDDPLQILGVDLATGADVPFPLDVSALDWRGSGGRLMVLGGRREVTRILDGAVLTIVDVLDGTSSQIPYPPTAIGQRADLAWITVHDVDPFDDNFVLVDGYLHPSEVRSVYTDGSWTDDPDVFRELLPLAVTETFGEPFELQLLDGAGDLVWAVSDFHSVGREGFHWAVADDVVIAMRCPEWDADGSCGWTEDRPPVEELVGFDIETGQELWTLPGYRSIPIRDGNRAVMTLGDDVDSTSDDGYALVDLLTGKRVGIAAWPVGAFAEECCGGYEYVNVAQVGAIVIATNEQQIRVWYPPELTFQAVSVDLMS